MLESAYKAQLFERNGSNIKLTATGEVFLKHTNAILDNYKALQLEMNLLTGNFTGKLRIGASTTIAQYVLPPIIARFIARFPDVRLSILSGNTEQIELALEEHKIDIGLIEGNHRKHSLKYTSFEKDELVLVTSTQNKIKEVVSLNELKALPLVLRETGSGTLEVIEEALADHGIKLSQMNVLFQLGNTESIKLFLANSPTVFAIVSIAAVSKELMNNTLKVVEITDLELPREFSIVVPQGAHNEIQERFSQFLMHLL